METRNKIMIFSDGACSGNPGPGGWGSIVLLPNNQVIELGGGSPSTTNNKMEMTAALEALRYVKNINMPVAFYTDSTYLIRGITQWIFGWRRNGWKTSEGAEVANREIWEALSDVLKDRTVANKIEWHYTRGHIGTPGNERCDQIAVAYSKNEFVTLYKGSLELYNVNILSVPEDTSLPAQSSSKVAEKKEAYSYLSNIGGTVYRHKSWPDCQRRTHGQSGAKFKKAKSAQDEQEILKSWGLLGSAVIKDS
jgi:ribonuclease HI